MTPRAKLAIGAAVIGVGVLVLVSSTKTASAKSLSSNGPTRSEWPADNMPWMMYSTTTLSAQRRYNNLANAANGQAIASTEFEGEGVGLYPLITEDGILGPESCDALGINMPRLDPSFSPPIACRGRI